MRLQQFLAKSGVASRRAGERMILAGRVEVNGKTVRLLGSKVDPARGRVQVDGEPIRERRKLYVAVNKPSGYVCTRRDPEGRRTIGELLPAEWGHLFPVGRLDYESEGLIFLTNDGDFCLRLTHPRYRVRKIYQVTVEGAVDGRRVRAMKQGTVEAGEQLKAEKARLVSSNDTRSVLELVMREGKNREVRRLLARLGLKVLRLVRVQIGKIRLGDLPAGRWRTLTESEIKSLLGNYDNETVAFHHPWRRDGAHPGRRPRAGGRRRDQQSRQTSGSQQSAA